MNFIKRGVQLSVGIAVTLFFLYWGFRNVDTSALLQSVARIEAKTIVPFIALFVVLFLLRTERWVVQVQGTIGRRPPFFKSLTINAIAFASVFFFPFRLGEFVRPYLCEREKLMSAATALSNSVLERVADGLMTCAVFGIVILMVPQGKLPDSTAIGGLVAISIFGGASIVLAIAYFFRDASVRFWTRLLTPLSIGLAEKLVGMLEAFLDGLSCVTQPIIFAKYVAITAAYWLLNGFTMWILMQGMGIDVSLLVAYFTLCFLVIGVMIPAGPGAVGTFHLAAITGLSLFGVEQNAGAAFALVLHAAQSLLVALWALFFLLTGSFKISDIKDATQSGDK